MPASRCPGLDAGSGGLGFGLGLASGLGFGLGFRLGLRPKQLWLARAVCGLESGLCPKASLPQDATTASGINSKAAGCRPAALLRARTA